MLCVLCILQEVREYRSLQGEKGFRRFLEILLNQERLIQFYKKLIEKVCGVGVQVRKMALSELDYGKVR